MNNQENSAPKHRAAYSRKYHLEHVILSTLWLDRYLSPSARRLGLVLSTWGHYRDVAVDDRRLRLLMGWDQTRLDAAREEISEKSAVWRVEAGSRKSRAGSTWRFIPAPQSPSEQGIEYPDWVHEDQIANWKPGYQIRAALKRSARFFAGDADHDADAVLLVILNAGFNFELAASDSAWTRWHDGVSLGLDVQSGIRRLQERGIISHAESGVWTFSPAWRNTCQQQCEFFEWTSRKESVKGSDPESMFEQRWLQRFRVMHLREEMMRAQAGSVADNEVGDELHAEFYALSIPDDPRAERATGYRSGEIVYIGMSTDSTRRHFEHRSWKNASTHNPRLHAIEAALRLIVAEDGEGLRLDMNVIESGSFSSLMKAALRERSLVKQYYADGARLVNRQYLEPGMDFIKPC